jgi:hypothetical protein
MQIPCRNLLPPRQAIGGFNFYLFSSLLNIILLCRRELYKRIRNDVCRCFNTLFRCYTKWDLFHPTTGVKLFSATRHMTIMAQMHDKIGKVGTGVFAMWKGGLEKLGPHEGKPNNHHFWWFLAVKEVGEGGDCKLLLQSSDRQTKIRLLLGRRIVDDWVPVILQSATKDAFPGNLGEFCTGDSPTMINKSALSDRSTSTNSTMAATLNIILLLAVLVLCN